MGPLAPRRPAARPPQEEDAVAFSAEWRPGEKGPQAGEPERPGLVLTADPLAGTLTPSGVPQEHPETPPGHSTAHKNASSLTCPSNPCSTL